MEEVYEKRRYRLLYTKKVDFSQFFLNYAQDINQFFKIKKKGEGLRALLDIDNDEEYAKLKHRMDPAKGKNLFVPKAYVPKRRFMQSWAWYDLPTFDTSLDTLNNLKKETREEKYKRIKSAKYFGRTVLEGERQSDDNHRTRTLTALDDFMVCLRVESIIEYGAGLRKYSPTQELWVPGRTSLEDIKDRIICPVDFEPAQPLITSPHQRSVQRKMDVNKFGMFYIGSNFYLDKRWESDPMHDYSVQVREWMEARNLDTGSVESMQDSCLQDMSLRLGYPYLYLHQGNCEHLLVFTDARLVKHQDLLFIEDYPLLKSFAALRGRFCVLCMSRLAKLCVVDCDTIPYDKAFICNICALSYLYDIDGNKKTNFTLYKYIDRAAII